tara:strand:+ start:772 stop:957 length:186 start_codon:yes stop_codon:yes gene_type:complete
MKETIIAPVTRREAVERIAELQGYIADICDIIYYQEPLRIQDRWLKVMTDKGLYTPDEDEE